MPEFRSSSAHTLLSAVLTMVWVSLGLTDNSLVCASTTADILAQFILSYAEYKEQRVRGAGLQLTETHGHR